TAGLLVFYVGLWAQGNLLVWAYGPFDGTPIDWSAHRAKGALELAVWTALFAIALLRAPQLRRHWFAVASLVLLLQAASLLGHFVEASPLSSRSKFPPPATEHGFNLYSSERNVLVIVLDALQSDFFAEALRAPEFAGAVPPGFVYYRNANSLYAATQFSLQSILTAAAVPDGVNGARWVQGAMRRRSVAADLASRGFDSAFVSFSRATRSFCGPQLPQRCILARRLVVDEPAALVEQASRAEVSEVFAVGLFRLVPHFLKPLVYDQGEWHLPELLPTSQRLELEIDPRIHASTRLDLQVLDRITHDLRVEDVPSRFRFLHLFGPHPPATVDRDCRLAAKGREGTGQISRDRAIETTRCILGRVFAYLRALEDAAIYDDTLVFIVSDHGNPKFPIDPSVAEPALPPASAEPSSMPSLASWSRGVPIFLAKNFGARGPLEVSDAPVSLCDIPISIYDALGYESEIPGRMVAALSCHSIFAGTRDRPDRMHYRYPAYAVQRRLPKEQRSQIKFRPYVIDGHSWHLESW
ncbi:MAG: sulfatase-like hydrolase/transferase, partial [Myxococcota bacterium]